MPAIKGDMYINTHCNYSQPTLIKLDNENIGGHLTPLHSVGLVPAPILPKMNRSHPKFLERCYPLTCPRVSNVFRTYSGKIDFSDPQNKSKK